MHEGGYLPEFYCSSCHRKEVSDTHHEFSDCKKLKEQEPTPESGVFCRRCMKVINYKDVQNA